MSLFSKKVECSFKEDAMDDILKKELHLKYQKQILN